MLRWKRRRKTSQGGAHEPHLSVSAHPYHYQDLDSQPELEQAMRDSFFDLVVGDKVVVDDRWRRKLAKVQTVVSVSPTRLVLDGIKEYNTFLRADGSRYGCSYAYEHPSIVGKATQAQVEAWEAHIAEQKAASDRHAEETRLKEERKQALSALFDRTIHVEEYTMEGKRYRYSIHNLTEADLKLCAAALERKP